MIRLGEVAGPTAGRLVYLRTEHSFIFLDRAPDVFGGGMLAFEMLSIEIDVSDGRLQYIDGFAPATRWKSRVLTPPEWVDRSLYTDDIPPGGMAYRAESISVGSGDFCIEYDSVKNLARVAQVDVEESRTAYRFCQGGAWGLRGNKIVDLWIIDPYLDSAEYH
ncbi:hypothetical protein [Rathayibacter rathayi]|uniref:hypothetical protein n=1 Tax=Rathayibacter rathayi TaxID=33887 RepID=UPI000FD8474A|nr:hypothetical protein [Rathayibacter rathayi]MWV75005.1 hypothetical protein [Rathayibacter rathayi NCPPB 2980 = VKM Ac-1601]